VVPVFRSFLQQNSLAFLSPTVNVSSTPPNKQLFQSIFGVPYKPFQQAHLHAYNGILLSKEFFDSSRRIGSTVGRQRDGHSTSLSGLPFAASGFPRRNQYFFIPLFEITFAAIYYVSHFALSSSFLHLLITAVHFSSSLASRVISDQTSSYKSANYPRLVFYSPILELQIRSHRNVR
jgi:hypothetical protein